MKKKNVLKVALICGGVAALGYLVKKAHDINEELNSIKLDNLTEDLFESDMPKTENEERIFARHYTETDEDTTEAELAEDVEETSNDESLETEETTEEVIKESEEVDQVAESLNQTEVEQVEAPEDVPLPPEVINKIGKLEDLLTFEGLDFDTNQRDYLYHIIEYMKKHHEMRVALLIGMNYNDKNPLEVFTDNQFAEIKKILR